MNWVDIALLTIVGLSIITSLIRGFVKEALSLCTWAAALFVAVNFSESFSIQLKDHIEAVTLRYSVAFLALFVGSIFIGAIFNSLIGKLIRKTPFSGADRALGSLFGFARGMLLASVLVMLLNIAQMATGDDFSESKLLPKFNVLSEKLSDYLPESVSQNSMIQKKDTLQKELTQKVQEKAVESLSTPKSPNSSNPYLETFKQR